MVHEQQALVIKNNWWWIFLPNKWPYLLRSEKYAPMRLAYLHWIFMIVFLIFSFLMPKLGSFVDRFYILSFLWAFFIGLYMLLRLDTWVPEKEAESFNKKYNKEKKAAYKYNKYTMITVSVVSLVGLVLKIIY